VRYRGADGRDYVTVLPPDAEVTSLLIERGVPVTARSQQQSGFTSFILSLLPFLLLIGVWIYFMNRMQGGGRGGAMGFGKSRAKLLTEKHGRVTFDDVAGIDEAKEELEEIVEFLRNPQKFSRLGGKIPKGALLVGPPGTGKTLLARAIAARRACPSSPSRARTSWRCSWAWAPAACATCSSRPRRTRPASSSSTRSTPWAGAVAWATAAATTSASRR
jgi:cell division protease FtsH